MAIVLKDRKGNILSTPFVAASDRQVEKIINQKIENGTLLSDEMINAIAKQFENILVNAEEVPY